MPPTRKPENRLWLILPPISGTLASFDDDISLSRRVRSRRRDRRCSPASISTDGSCATPTVVTAADNKLSSPTFARRTLASLEEDVYENCMSDDIYPDNEYAKNTTKTPEKQTHDQQQLYHHTNDNPHNETKKSDAHLKRAALSLPPQISRRNPPTTTRQTIEPPIKFHSPPPTPPPFYDETESFDRYNETKKSDAHLKRAALSSPPQISRRNPPTTTRQTIEPPIKFHSPPPTPPPFYDETDSYDRHNDTKKSAAHLKRAALSSPPQITRRNSPTTTRQTEPHYYSPQPTPSPLYYDETDSYDNDDCRSALEDHWSPEERRSPPLPFHTSSPMIQLHKNPGFETLPPPVVVHRHVNSATSSGLGLEYDLSEYEEHTTPSPQSLKRSRSRMTMASSGGGGGGGEQRRDYNEGNNEVLSDGDGDDRYSPRNKNTSMPQQQQQQPQRTLFSHPMAAKPPNMSGRYVSEMEMSPQESYPGRPHWVSYADPGTASHWSPTSNHLPQHIIPTAIVKDVPSDDEEDNSHPKGFECCYCCGLKVYVTSCKLIVVFLFCAIALVVLVLYLLQVTLPGSTSPIIGPPPRPPPIDDDEVIVTPNGTLSIIPTQQPSDNARFATRPPSSHPSFQPSHLATTPLPSLIPTTIPSSSSPTTIETGRISSLTTFIVSLSGESALRTGTEQNKALRWLLYHDPMRLEVDDERVVPRYVLMVLYYGMSGVIWVKNKGFGSGWSECEWYGVICNAQNKMTALGLRSNKVTGIIPTEIALLQTLTTLSFSRNNVYGTIPPAIGNLTKLRYLTLNGNQLEGPIPSTVVNLNKLQRLHLQNNILSGTIPDNLNSLPDLIQIWLDRNYLEGSIPFTLGFLINLSNLDLSSNLLSGPIPDELGNLLELNHLDLSDNLLADSIPSQITHLSRLERLILSSNRLTGSIPSQIGYLLNLKEFRISDNLLSGHVPSDLGYLKRLKRLHVDNNFLSGTIPSSFGQLNQLSELKGSDNHLVGTLPERFGRLSNLLILELQFNGLSGVVAESICQKPPSVFTMDCGGEEPLVECECCTRCCFEWVCSPT